MKNCLVLSGQYRTFDKTCESIKQFIEKNNLDVYCNIWYENDEQLDKIQNELRPKSLSVLYQDLYGDMFQQIENNIRTNNPKGPNQDKLAGNASMNFCKKSAYDLVPSGYDVIVSSRYDLMLGSMVIENIPPVVITPTEQAYAIISDIFAVLPTQFAKHYFLSDVYEKLHSTKFEPEFIEFLKTQHNYPDRDINIHNNERYCPHMMLLRNLIMNNVPFTQMDLPVRIER